MASYGPAQLTCYVLSCNQKETTIRLNKVGYALSSRLGGGLEAKHWYFSANV